MSKGDKVQCPNCKRFSSVYYCTECVQRGNFYHSTKTMHLKSYAQVKLEENQIRLQKKLRSEKALSDPPLALKEEKLKYEIELLKEKNELLKMVIKTEKKKNVYSFRQIKRLEAENVENRRKNEKFRLRIEGFCENITLYNKNTIEKRSIISEIERKRAMFFKYPVISTIVNDIFCFREKELEPSKDDENPATRQMVMSIDDAAHTNYVRGRWVTEDHFSNRNFLLAGTILPGSAEYATFVRARCKDEETYKDEVANIFAGLSLLCQMVNTIAYIFKIPLPKSVTVKDFIHLSFEDLTGKKFQKFVTRLNANVFFLCLLQGVNSSSLRPLNPLINMHALLTDPNVAFGRLGRYEIPQSIIDVLEDHDIEDFPDSDTDSEWDLVNASQLPEIPSISPPRRRISFDETASSVVTSAAASVLSMFGLGNN